MACELSVYRYRFDGERSRALVAAVADAFGPEDSLFFVLDAIYDGVRCRRDALGGRSHTLLVSRRTLETLEPHELVDFVAGGLGAAWP